MNDSCQSPSVPSGNGLSRNSTQGITEADVRVTALLASRPARQPDLAAEIQALQILAQQLVDDPQAMLKTLVGIVLERCQAGSAGVSLLETTPNGESVFRWVAVSGALADLEQTTIPVDFSPCSTTLCSNQPQLYAYPERYFTYLHHPQFPILEGLLIPLGVNRQPLGTLWLLSHDQARRFDSEDQRLMTSLAGFTASALQSIQQLRQKAEVALQREQEAHTEQERAKVALRQTEELNQQIFSSSDDCLKVLDLSGRLLYMNQRGQVLIGLPDLTLLLNQSWVEFWQGADRQAALNALNTAKAGGVGNFQGYCPTLAGEPKWWDVKLTPIRGVDGQVERLLCISRDITERSLTEAALRASEAKYRMLFNSMDEGFCILQMIFDDEQKPIDYRFIEINVVFEQQTGFKNALGRTIRELVPDIEEFWLDIYGKVALTGKPTRFVNRAESMGRWFDVNAFRIGEPQERKVAVLFKDISNRKKFEQERERFLDLGSDLQLITSINGYFQWVSPTFERTLGWSPDEMASHPWTDFIHPDDIGESVLEADNLFSGNKTFAFENRYRHKDGSYRWLLWKAEAYPEEQVIYGAAVDITERKQAEAEREQLLANERHYANQLQGLTTAALAINSALSVEEVLQVITDQAALIIGAHQSVTSMTIGQNWAQAINAVHMSDKYAQWRGYDEIPDGSGIYACVCHLNRSMRMTQAELEAHPCWKGFGLEADKHPPMDGWLAAPLVGRDGHNIGLIQLSDKDEGEFTPSDESILVQLAQMASVAVENARLYEAEQQARAAAEASWEEAQAANRVKDEFLAVLSHELRSPLNPILGWSTLLQNKKLDEAKTAQALAIIQRNAKLQSELIEDLLDVSRILQGKLSLNVAPVNLASIIQAAMETVRLAAEAKSIKLEANLEPDVGFVSGDSTRLQQVIWNLVSNAVKFTPEGGQVNIRLERLDLYAQITVSDTGQGIAPDFLPYVFDYFRQADAATTRKFGGLGLGLAIVRRLAELHGGTVKVESPGEGKGATFIVRLPLMPAPSTANQDERSPQPAVDLNGIKILVVDDETDTREFVVFLLEQEGAQVTAVSSAHEALVILAQSKPDALLSDIGMPDMDGYMLLQQVRALSPHGGQIPAIALTAYAGDINQQQVIAAGFQKHISKPIEPQVLVQEIASLVGCHVDFDKHS